MSKINIITDELKIQNEMLKWKNLTFKKFINVFYSVNSPPKNKYYFIFELIKTISKYVFITKAFFLFHLIYSSYINIWPFVEYAKKR